MLTNLKPDSLAARQSSLSYQIIRVASSASLIIVIIMFFGWLVLRIPQLLAYSIIILPIVIAGYFNPRLLNTSNPKLGAVLFLSATLFTFTATALLMPELTQVVNMAFVAVILLAYMMLGSRSGTRFAVTCGIAMSLVMITDRYIPFQWFAPLGSNLAFILGIFNSLFVIIAVTILVQMIFSEQEHAFQRSETAQEQFKEAAENARQSQERLETIIQEYGSYLAQVSRGNMLVQLELDGRHDQTNDPLIVLGGNLVNTTANLRQMILKVKDATGNITSASTEILAANTQQASSASQTSAAIAQTTTTVEEMRTLAEHVLLRAQEVADAAQKTMAVSQSGQQAVTNTIKSMLDIRGQVEGIATSILTLSEKTQQIGDIIAAVSEIADQSHMLALNASIEAARAGEAGKGFSVVALEMRSLAEQSRKATFQIEEILSDIQRATNSTVMATEEGSKGVDIGVRQAEQTNQSIEQLSAAIQESAQIALQLTAGGRQQQTGIEQVVTTMQHINEAIMQNVASSRQTEKATRNLNDLARVLTEMVEKYKV